MYIEMEFIGDGVDGLKTGIGCQCEKDEDTKKLFDEAKRFDVGAEKCDYLMDLKTEDEILDTIGITTDVFELLTGEKGKTVEEYKSFDQEFWQHATRMMAENAPDVLELKE